MALSTSRTVLTQTGINTFLNYDIGGLNSAGIATFSNFKTGTTDVHSVGVNAATMVVGSAVTSNSDGIEVTGIVTATSFVGSGANLTGIDATAIQTGTTKVQTVASRVDTKIDNVGILTVTSSGVNVTGIVTANSFVAGGTALGSFTEGSIISCTSNGGNEVSTDTILSTTKRFEVFILSMSLNGASDFRFRLRNASGDVTSGYSATGGYVSNASYANETHFTGGYVTQGMASGGNNWSGHITFKNYKDHYWYMNGDLWWDGGETHYWMHGHVNLGAQITGVRFDSTGSGTFDAGELRINQYSTP